MSAAIIFFIVFISVFSSSFVFCYIIGNHISYHYIFDTGFFNIFGMNCLKMARIGILWYTNPMSKRLYLF